MSYKRYPDGNDFDGTFFQSLSLEDTGHATANIYNRHYTAEYDEDLMEIDYEHDKSDFNLDHANFTPEPISSGDPDILTPINKLSHFASTPAQSTPINEDKNSNETISDNKSEELQEHEKEIENEDADLGEANSSIVSSLLSPTILGARLAIRLPRLLLPPPSRKGSVSFSDIDHEYDTSSFRDHSATLPISKFGNYKTPEPINRLSNLNFRNVSSFSLNSDLSTFLASKDENDDTEEYIYNPRDGNYLSFNNNRTFDNSLNRSYLYRQSFNGLADRSAASFINRSHMDTSAVQIHHHHYYYGGNDDTANRTIGSPEHTGAHTRTLQLSATGEPNLPSPWQSNISPIARVPYLLASYLQLIINLVVSAYTIYILYQVISTIRRDINVKLDLHAKNILSEIQSCTRQYKENGCGPDTVGPELEEVCASLAKCMNQSPHKGSGNASLISAETIGLIINSLVEPLGLKVFLFLFGTIAALFACNFTFGYIRAKTYYGWNSELIANPAHAAIPGSTLSGLGSTEEQLFSPGNGSQLVNTPKNNANSLAYTDGRQGGSDNSGRGLWKKLTS